MYIYIYTLSLVTGGYKTGRDQRRSDMLSGGGTGRATGALAPLIVMFRGLSPPPSPPKCTVCAP